VGGNGMLLQQIQGETVEGRVGCKGLLLLEGKSGGTEPAYVL
jgi:hypothetical protein